MRLPIFRGEKRYKRQVINFGGINLMQSYSDGEVSDCSGISHISFPALTQRQKSEKVFSCSHPSAAVFANKECIAANDGLYYDRKKVGELSSGDKQLAYMGNKVLVFPDKVYYDVHKQKFGSLQAEYLLSGIDVAFSDTAITVPSANYVTTATLEQSVFSNDASVITYTGVSESNGKLTLSGFSLQNVSALSEDTIFCEKCDKNQYRIVMSVDEMENGKGYTVTNKLMTLENTLQDVFSEFNVGDVVEISGCKNIPSNNKMARITAKSKTALSFSETTFSQTTETADITIKRKIPDFTCICSYENRLWGCEGSTIYASALGDPFNFFIYRQLSTDSFTVESNTSGDFTGCVAYGNCCLFFKENACYKLYGNRPSNFQLTESFGTGISKSEQRSITSVNGKILYNGNGGVFAFYGGIPQCVSQKIHGVTLKNTVAGSDGRRYYITSDTDNGREEFVYDIERDLWSKSGISDIGGYAFFGGTMYRFTLDAVEKILDEADENAQWHAVLCPFDEGYYKTKNYSRLHVCARLFDNSWIRVEVKRDNAPWRVVATEYGSEKKYVNIPFVIKSCHEVQLRISGKGKSVVESITREFSVN